MFRSLSTFATGAWSAKTNAVSKEWIAASFYNVIIMRGVVVAGRADTDEWVLAFKLQYQYDYFSSWYWYEDPPGTTKVIYAFFLLLFLLQYQQLLAVKMTAEHKPN